MTRLTIIGEGQTEQAFCNDILSPFFLDKTIYLHNPVINKTGGGIVVSIIILSNNDCPIPHYKKLQNVQ